MATTAAAEHATLANQKVKVTDLAKMAAGNGKFTSALLAKKYGISKATFDAIKTRMTT